MKKQRLFNLTVLSWLLVIVGSSCTTEDQLYSPTSANVTATFSLRSPSALNGKITIREAYMKLDRVQVTGSHERGNTDITHVVPPADPPFQLSKTDSNRINFALPFRIYDQLEFHHFLYRDTYELVFDSTPIENAPESPEGGGTLPDNGGQGNGEEDQSDNESNSDDDESNDESGEEAGDDGKGDDNSDQDDRDDDGDGDSDDGDSDENDSENGDSDEGDKDDESDRDEDGNTDEGSDSEEDEDKDDEGKDDDKGDDKDKKDKEKDKDKDKDKNDDRGDNDEEDDDDKDGDKNDDDGRTGGTADGGVVNLDHFFQNAKPGLLVIGSYENNGRMINLIFVASDIGKLTVRARQNDSFNLLLNDRNSAAVTFDPEKWFEGLAPADIESAQTQVYQQQEVLFIHPGFNTQLYQVLAPRLEESVKLNFDASHNP